VLYYLLLLYSLLFIFLPKILNFWRWGNRWVFGLPNPFYHLFTGLFFTNAQNLLITKTRVKTNPKLESLRTGFGKQGPGLGFLEALFGVPYMGFLPHFTG